MSQAETLKKTVRVPVIHPDELTKEVMGEDSFGYDNGHWRPASRVGKPMFRDVEVTFEGAPEDVELVMAHLLVRRSWERRS